MNEIQIWNYIVDIAIISILILISVVLKRNVGFFRKYPIPIPIIAGFMGLILGKDVLGIISFNSIRLENLVYHMMNIGFIALSLKASSKVKGKEYVNSGMFIVINYIVQGIVGFGLSLIFFYTIFPEVCPISGLLLPLGFGQGPAQAYSNGHQWEQLGFTNGGNLGLTVAAVGYIWACAGGIPLIAWLKKSKGMKPSAMHSEKIRDSIFDEDKPNELPLKESIDGLTLQLMLVGMVYLLTYLTLRGAEALLGNEGFGGTLSKLLWGFSFIIGAVYGMIVRRVLDACFKAGWMKYDYTSNYLLERLSGASFDFMIVAAISAISIYMLKGYIVPFLIITTIGGLVTVFFIVWLAKRVYREETLENTLAMYGMLTGTISTGIALLREVDPHFQTNAARNLVLGSGTGLAFGTPLMVILTIPVIGLTENQPIFYFITLGAFAVYLAVLMTILFLNTRKPRLQSAGSGEKG
jgi:ESS family glutamate:Na+ symporter